MANLNISQVLNINIKNEDIDLNSIWGVFDKKLYEAIDSEYNSITLILKKEMGCDDVFIDWIQGWYETFSKYGKDIRFVSANKDQIQALAHLKYSRKEKKTSPLDELEEIYLLMKPKEESPLSIKNTFEKTDIINSILEKKNDMQFPYLCIGEAISISGEYRCLSCGHFEYFISGKRITACTHNDCQSQKKGWQLVLGIF